MSKSDRSPPDDTDRIDYSHQLLGVDIVGNISSYGGGECQAGHQGVTRLPRTARKHVCGWLLSRATHKLRTMIRLRYVSTSL